MGGGNVSMRMARLNVIPTSSREDTLDGSGMHPVSSGKLHFGDDVFNVGCADRKNLSRRQFGSTRFLASRRSTLGFHVSHVVGMRAEEQMRGVAARGVIAPVKCVEFTGPFPCCQKPANDVGEPFFAEDAKHPVPLVHEVALPNPARSKVRASVRDRSILFNSQPVAFELIGTKPFGDGGVAVPSPFGVVRLAPALSTSRGGASGNGAQNCGRIGSSHDGLQEGRTGQSRPHAHNMGPARSFYMSLSKHTIQGGS